MIKTFINKLEPEVVNFVFVFGFIVAIALLAGTILVSCDDSPPQIGITEESLVKMLQDAQAQGSHD